MRVIQLDRFGEPDVLYEADVPDAVLGEGEVLIRTAAAGVTFVETQVRAGRWPWAGPGPALPAVLGNGVEGEVTAVGSGAEHMLGRRVVSATGGSGGYADHVVVPSTSPVVIPDALELGEAVAMLADGRTALALRRAGGVIESDTVLITAAAGGVGRALVQLARSAGARHVVALARGAEKLRLCRDLGADIAIDYTAARWADHVLGEVGPVDVAFDGVGGTAGAACLGLLRTGGRFSTYGAASGTWTDTSGAASRWQEDSSCALAKRGFDEHSVVDHRWAVQDPDVIPLTAADSDFPVCEDILEALQRHLAEGYLPYGPNEGLPALRRAAPSSTSVPATAWPANPTSCSLPMALRRASSSRRSSPSAGRATRRSSRTRSTSCSTGRCGRRAAWCGAGRGGTAASTSTSWRR